MNDFMKFIQKLIDEFTGKPSNKNTNTETSHQDIGPKEPKAPSQLPNLLPLILVIVLVGLFVKNNLYVVEVDEFVIVRQFGEIVKVEDLPGLRFKVPFVQTITKLPNKILIYDVPPAEINTLDKKRMMVDYYSLWRVTDPKQMIESLRTLSAAESRLGDIVYSSIRTELGKMNYGDIINDKKDSRGGLDEVVNKQVNETLDRNLSGIVLVDIKMKRADLPASNEESVYQRMISERESTAQEYLSQGDAEALKIVAETDRKVAEMLSKAEADAMVIESEGEKEAARIYNASYSKDAEFFNMYRSLESYKTTINGETVMILPLESPYLKYLVGR
ncbi:MAG: protease modulator HflC [Tissierellia bacterium]|nr:protease modulator HflC [Tissierellia bacterium]